MANYENLFQEKKNYTIIKLERRINMKIKNLKKEIKAKLSPYRYKHSIMVAEEAKKLAKHYHINPQKAYITGLLHDIAKELPEIDNEYWIEKGNLSKNLQKEEYKNIKHADIGAIIAREKYNLNNDMCNAIKYHTIGNKNMNMLAKIIFIADKIGRPKIPDVLKPVKVLAYQDINKALLYCIEKQELKLQEKGLKLHQDTKELQNVLNKK